MSSSRTTVLRASEGTDRLWAKAAELERDFAGYKRRLEERRAQAVAEVAARAEEDGDAAGRGRRYEEYVRRRDERLRQEWRARMERKEAEMQALWARLDRTGSRGRRSGGDGGEVAAASYAREDQVKLQQKPGNLVVKAKPTAPVTPRCNPAAKLTRPRTSVSSSPATASPRLSTPDPRRRPSHLHREQPQPQPEPPATPRKENRLPPPPTTLAVASPATPRPRTMLSRSRSLFKDRGCSSVTVRESPRPPRFQPPRSSYDSASVSNFKEPAPSPRVAVTVTQSSSCSSEQAALADVKKASAVAPEPFYARRSGNGVEPASPPLVVPRDEADSSDPAGGGNADNKSSHEYQSSDKLGGADITGDSDTEPSYVYIKRDSGEQTPRPPQASAGLGIRPVAEPRSDNEDSDNVEDTMESTGSNDIAGETPTADEEEGSRRESSESLYSNVQSSFSPGTEASELDTSATESPLPSATKQSPEPDASPRRRKNTEVQDAEKTLPIPTTPRRSGPASIAVQSPMDTVNGLKRLLTFGKRNGKTSEAAPAVERASHAVAPAPSAGDHGSVSGGWPAGGSVKQRLGFADVAVSDDLDNSYVISPHVGSLQSFVPSVPVNSELKKPILHAKSPRVHRSFFSFSSFKSRAN